MSKYKLIIFLLILGFFQNVKSQEFTSAQDLEKFLARAELQAQNYRKVFQNLSAEEIKTKIYYKPDGTIDEKRVIKSNFIVYQSSNTNSIDEFRNVVEFNGKNVARDEKESQKFFEKLAKIGSQAEEYRRLFNESLRFDGKYVEWGMTLEQSRPFKNNIKDCFSFRIVSQEKLNNRKVWVIEYNQIKHSPYIQTNPTKEENNVSGGTQYNVRGLSDNFRPTYPLMNGKIWLDAETGQIWRNDFKIFLNPKKWTKPIQASEFSYQYQPSDFGILVPKKFQINTYQIKGKDEKTLQTKKDAEITYEYSKFSEFKTETKEYKTGH